MRKVQWEEMYPDNPGWFQRDAGNYSPQQFWQLPSFDAAVVPLTSLEPLLVCITVNERQNMAQGLLMAICELMQPNLNQDERDPEAAGSDSCGPSFCY